MVVIELQNVQFQAYHGLYEGEEKTGGPYEVNAKVTYEETDTSFDDLRSTINYVEIFNIVKQRMQVPTPLLEKVAAGIIRKIRHSYPFVTEVSISIYKLEPPITGFQGKIGVTLYQKFERR
ncbi:MAG: dihydroneopterin aldolase [Chitinophagaceae bacterium]